MKIHKHADHKLKVKRPKKLIAELYLISKHINHTFQLRASVQLALQYKHRVCQSTKVTKLVNV